MAVTEIRTIAMVAEKVGEKGAFIFGLPDQEKSSFFLPRCGGEERGFVFPPECGFLGGRCRPLIQRDHGGDVPVIV
jgi:hypothetical protein